MASLELKKRLDNLLSTYQKETKDIDLFAPILVSEREECHICMIPLPLDENETNFMSCCGKSICNGCTYKEVLNDLKSGIPTHGLLDKLKCAFCRQATGTNENTIKATKKLMKKNNPQAYMQMASYYKRGGGGFQSDTKSLEMIIRAAELGNAWAYSFIGDHYARGIIVEQDISKAKEFYEIAAKKGSIYAHKCLAINHKEAGNNQLSIDHWKVAANAGDQVAMDNLMKIYKNKAISKLDLAQTLRAFQTSSNEMKSIDRDIARMLEEAITKGEEPSAELLDRLGHGVFKRSCRDQGDND